MQAKERLFFTADRKRVVAEGDQKAAFLYAAPGDEIPESAAEKFGLVDGRLKGRKPAADKSKAPDNDKSGKPDGDKSKKPGADKSGKPDDDKASKGGLTIKRAGA